MESDGQGLRVTFSQFVITLASSALVHLGEQADPATGTTSINLPLARHSIDVIGVLEEKTKGNLDDEEAKLVDTLLFELRSKFIEISQSQPS